MDAFTSRAEGKGCTVACPEGLEQMLKCVKSAFLFASRGPEHEFALLFYSSEAEE